MEDIIDIIVTETTNTIEITSQPTDEIIDVNIIDNREDVTLNVTPTLVEININSLTGNFGILWGEIEGTLSNQTDLNTALGLKADLVGGKVPSSQLPSYVDDVVEVANYAALPATGETGKIYVTIDTNYIYRWTGSVYVEIKDSSAVWGAITGTLSNQTDLQNALNAKDAVLTFSSPLSRSTNTVSIPAATTSVNGYLTSTDWTTFNAKQAALNGTGFVKISGTTISYDNTSYLPLTGGTLTGNLLGTNITISNSLIAKGGTFNGGALSGGVVTIDGLGSDLLMNRADTSNGASITLLTNAVEKWNIGLRSAGTTDNFFIYNSNLTANAITINSSNSATTFASSVTATSLIKSGGTSSQFLKADGSVDSSTYLTTGTASSTYLPLSGGTLTGALSGTSISLSSSVTASALYVTGMTAGSGAIYHTGSRLTFANYNASGTLHFEVNGGQGALTLNADKSASFVSTINATGATLTGALSGTSANFSDTITINKTGASALTLGQGTSTNDYGRINFYGKGTGSAVSLMYMPIFNTQSGSGVLVGELEMAHEGSSADNKSYFSLKVHNGTSLINPLYIGATGAATFSSSVSGISHRVYNGATTIGYLIRAADWGDSGNNLGIAAETTLGINFYTNGSATPKVIINSSGNVGIGTTSPASNLEVYVSTYQRIQTYFSSPYTSGFKFSDLNGQIIFNAGTDNMNIASNAAGGNITLTTVSTPRVTITSGGNVGIGTSSPSRKLEVVISDSTAYTTSSLGNNLGIGNTSPATNSFSGITFYAEPTNGNAGISAINNIVTGSGDAALAFSTRGSSTLAERMRITSGGSLLIGEDTTSAAKLYVKDTVNGNTFGARNTSSVFDSTLGFFGADRNTTNNTFYFISAYNYGASAYKFRVADSGNVTNTNNSYGAISDIKLKENISDATSKLSDLLKIKVKNYNYIGSDEKQLGVIAQDVEQIFPALIETHKDKDSDGNDLGTVTKSVKYSVFVPMLIKAVQELSDKITTLENK